MIDYTEMLAALTADYLNVFVARPKEDSADIIKLTGYVTRGINDVPQGFQYSKLLRTYAEDRVYEEDRDYFLEVLSTESLLKVFSDGRDRLEYNYRIMENGEIHHYGACYIRVSKPEDELSLVVGFRNVDAVVNIGQEKRIEGLRSAYSAISSIFFSMHRVDVQNNTYTGIKTTPTIQHLTIPDSDDYDANADRIIRGVSSEWSRDEALDFVKRSTLQERMAGKNHISIEFLSYASELCELHFFREGDDVNAPLKYVIFAVEKVDEEKNQAIIDALSHDFKNVFWIDLATGESRVLKMKGYIDEGIEEKGVQKFLYNDLCMAFIANRIHPDDREQQANMISLEHLREHFKDHDELNGSFRVVVDGVMHHYSYAYYKIGNMDSVVAGFRNVDDVVRQHVAQEKKERELEEARNREARERSEVISSLSTIYSTIFKAEIDTHHYEVLNSVSLMNDIAHVSGNFDEVKEEIVTAFMAPEMRDQMREFLDLNTLAARLEKVNTVSTEYRNPAGRWFQARFITKKRDEAGNAREVLYVARDYTDEKLQELEQQNQLSNALAAAQQASKAKSTFLNSMSHDIRTPMNAIIGFTALAQTHIDDQEQVQDYLAKISTSSTHLLSLINDILDMSRIESGTVKLEEKPVHIPDVLHDLRTMIQSLINSKNLNLYIDTQDVMHEDVVTDKLRLNQVLINIVGNAIKFTPPGGDIIIRLLEKPCKLKNYATYVFSVKDNGIGMSKNFLEHIFESFSREYSTTVSGIQGTGLGMAITKNIVDMMGGTITADSVEGKGSLFTVTLNLRLTNVVVKNEPIPELLGARALVADDDLDTCRSVSKMLRTIKMRPDWTASGKEAVVRAQDAAEMKDEYKVYIIDYLMPDMNGIETIRRIRRVISEEAAIIVLTAYDWSDIEYEAREAGVTAFVSKPLFMSELRSALTQTKEVDTGVQLEKAMYDYSGKRVLLVEDNELNREIATAILEEAGIQVDCASDGTEAVDIMYKADEDTYDLIFMDIQMPQMDGYTATHEIRTFANNKKANIPIVAMTANAFEEDKKRSFEAGMNGHIAKPISMEQIAKALDTIFAEK